jgi:hypothetical protein
MHGVTRCGWVWWLLRLIKTIASCFNARALLGNNSEKESSPHARTQGEVWCRVLRNLELDWLSPTADDTLLSWWFGARGLLTPWCCWSLAFCGKNATVTSSTPQALQRISSRQQCSLKHVCRVPSTVGAGYQALSELLASERYVTVVGVGNILWASSVQGCVGAMHVCRAGVNSLVALRGHVCAWKLLDGGTRGICGR